MVERREGNERSEAQEPPSSEHASPGRQHQQALVDAGMAAVQRMSKGLRDKEVGEILALDAKSDPPVLEVQKRCATSPSLLGTFSALRISDVVEHIGLFRLIADKEGSFLPGVPKIFAAGAASDFERYLRVCRPTLSSAGPEIDSFLTFRNEAGDPTRFHGRVPHVRNYHRFHVVALEALARNWKDQSKRRPLRLLIASGRDHNGGFHRMPAVAAMLTEPSHLTLMLEGEESLDAIQAQLAPLAKSYGQGDKIEQVVLFGHANATRFELTGEDGGGLTSAFDVSKPATDLAINDPRDRPRTLAFMDELLGHVGGSAEARAQIVLWGCHSDGGWGLSAEDVESQGRPLGTEELNHVLAKQSNLAGVLRERARRQGKSIDVQGFRTLVWSTYPILQPGTGHLAPRADRDVAATASDPLSYVERGVELPVLVESVQLAWPRRAALQVAIGKRLQAPVSDPYEPLARAMLKLVLSTQDPTVLVHLNALAGLASAYSDGFELIKLVASLEKMPAWWRAPLFNAIVQTPVWKTIRVRAAVLQSWCVADPSHDAELMREIDANPADEALVDVRLIRPALPRLLRTPNRSAPPAERKLAFSLLAQTVLEGYVEPTVKRYLLAILGGSPHFPWDVKPYLPKLYGLDGEADVLASLGLGPAPLNYGSTPPAERSVGKVGVVQVATTLSTPVGGVPKVVDPRMRLKPGDQVVVMTEVGGNPPWYKVHTSEAGGWVRADQVTILPDGLPAEQAVRPGAPDAPIRVLVTGYEPKGNPSSVLARRLAELKIPGAVLTTKVLPLEWKAVDAFIEHDLAESHADIVVGLGFGINGERNIEGMARNWTAGSAEDGPREQPTRTGGPVAIASTLPMERIRKDQERQLGRQALPISMEMPETNTFLCNYIQYRELDATRGTGAMVGFIHVASERDLPAVAQVIRSSMDELRERRRAWSRRVSSGIVKEAP